MTLFAESDSVFLIHAFAKFRHPVRLRLAGAFSDVSDRVQNNSPCMRPVTNEMIASQARFVSDEADLRRNQMQEILCHLSNFVR